MGEIVNTNPRTLRLLRAEYIHTMSIYEIESLEDIDYETIVLYGKYIEYYKDLIKQIEGVLNDYQLRRN